MSDEEEVMHSEEEESDAEEDSKEEPETPTRREMAPPEPSGPSEAELAMQRRRAQQTYGNLDDDAQELLAHNKIERDGMAQEISELRKRSEQRKKEREQEEKRMSAKRAEEERQRRTEEEERRKKKEDEESERRAKRAEKMAEFEKWKNPPTPNFVITKKAADGTTEEDAGSDAVQDKVSREQLEAEKKAILAQRIPKLDTSGMDSAKLADKAKEMHTLVFRLECEKYDLEKRFKAQQYDMMELAERARQMNKVGRGGLKRVGMAQNDEVDKMQERFAGCPSKIVTVGKYDRQMDSRPYGSRKEVFKGPVYGFAAERINPTRILKWSEAGLPEYEDIPGAVPAAAEEEE